MMMKASAYFTLLCLSLYASFNLLGVLAHARTGINVATTDNPSKDCSSDEKTGKKSKILIIGALGEYGRFMVGESTKNDHPTVAIVDPESLAKDPKMVLLVQDFIQNHGVEIIYGDFTNQTLLERTMKGIDVVISSVQGARVLDQRHIISAIKKVPSIKRFFPSEYTIDVDRVHDPIEPAKTLYENRAKIRRMVEAARIPHTFVVANGFGELLWPNLAQLDPTALLPNITHVTTFGDGNSKITASLKEDVAKYVVKAIDDPRTLNKILYLRPPENIISFNDLYSMWEEKSGIMLKKTYLQGEQLLEMMKEAPKGGLKVQLSICYSVAIKNDYDSYAIEPSIGVVATELYPQVEYTTVDEYLDGYLPHDTTFNTLLSTTKSKPTTGASSSI